MSQLKAWIREPLGLFLIAQLILIGGAAAGGLAYMVNLENRVHTMETRGAEYTVARMEEMKQRITVLEQADKKTTAQLERIVDIMTGVLKK